uniref:SPK domain-containing protein n=1 Tax=Caenorhabditis tropicalis TaxID=1561998 RepID=A0A1I7U9Y5_9PELO
MVHLQRIPEYIRNEMLRFRRIQMITPGESKDKRKDMEKCILNSYDIEVNDPKQFTFGIEKMKWNERMRMRRRRRGRMDSIVFLLFLFD